MGDAIESEEKIVWSNGMIAIADKHGLKTIEVPITEIYVSSWDFFEWKAPKEIYDELNKEKELLLEALR